MRRMNRVTGAQMAEERGVGVHGVFYDDEFQMGVLPAQIRE